MSDPPAERPPKGLHLSRGLRALDVPIIVTEHYRPITTGWLARINPHPDGLLSFCREFINGKVSGRRSGYGSRVYRVDTLNDGVYEAESMKAPSLAFRTYIEIRGGAITRYSGLARDAAAWLKEG